MLSPTWHQSQYRALRGYFRHYQSGSSAIASQNHSDPRCHRLDTFSSRHRHKPHRHRIVRSRAMGPHQSSATDEVRRWNRHERYRRRTVRRCRCRYCCVDSGPVLPPGRHSTPSCSLSSARPSLRKPCRPSHAQHLKQRLSLMSYR